MFILFELLLLAFLSVFILLLSIRLSVTYLLAEQVLGDIVHILDHVNVVQGSHEVDQLVVHHVSDLPVL